MVNSDGFEKEDTWFGMNSYGKGGPPRNKHSETGRHHGGNDDLHRSTAIQQFGGEGRIAAGSRRQSYEGQLGATRVVRISDYVQ